MLDNAIKVVHNDHYCDKCDNLVKIDNQKYCSKWSCDYKPKEADNDT